MENKNTGIIATIVATLLCGCPGLLLLCGGPLTAIIIAISNSGGGDLFGGNPSVAIGIAVGGICVGIIFIVITIGVGVLMLRKKPAADAAVIEVSPPISNEPPVPPAI